MDKKAVSLMLSYVLLISLAIVMALLIYAGLKIIANVKQVQSCEQGTHLIITDESCNDEYLTLSLKNNGRFNIEGFIMSYSNDKRKKPTDPMLLQEDSDVGHYYFTRETPPNPLEPEVEKTITINRKTVNRLEKISIQPFVKSETTGIVVCEEAVIVQEVDCPII